MKRELREVMRMLGELESALRDEETRVLRLGREIKDLTSLLDRLEGEKREAEKHAMTSGHMLQQLESEMTRVAERLETCGGELQRLRADREEQVSLMTLRQAELEELQQRREELERLASAANEELAALREDRDRATQNASQYLARAATLEERHRAAAAVLERMGTLVADMSERVGSLQREIEGAVVERVQRETENRQLAGLLDDLTAERNASEAREGLLQFESDQVRARLTEIDEALRGARQLLDQARDRRGELAAAVAKLQSDAEYMAETCLNELGMQRPELMADATIAIVAGEQLAAEDQAQREMRSRLDAMGPVNMMALEEYQETADRHAFLDTQRKDLLDSIANTQATIAEIDTFSRQKFAEAFGRINENFQATFKKLFGGRPCLHAADGRGKQHGERHRRGGFASGKEVAERAVALGRRKGADRAGAAGGHLPVSTQPVLHSGRSGRAAGRSQHWAFHGSGERDECANPVRAHHPQQENHEHRAGVVWSHHAGARGFEVGFGTHGCNRRARKQPSGVVRRVAQAWSRENSRTPVILCRPQFFHKHSLRKPYWTAGFEPRLFVNSFSASRPRAAAVSSNLSG